VRQAGHQQEILASLYCIFLRKFCLDLYRSVVPWSLNTILLGCLEKCSWHRN